MKIAALVPGLTYKPGEMASKQVKEFLFSTMDDKKMKIDDQNVTEKFIAVSSDYIQMAEDIKSAENHAYLAVIAWNLSLYPQDQIPGQIELISREYEKSNPGVIQAELLAHDLQLLVEKKQKKFPNLRMRITKIGVEGNGEEYKITTEAIPFEVQ